MADGTQQPACNGDHEQTERDRAARPGLRSADELAAAQQQYGYYGGRHRCLDQLGTTSQVYRDRGAQQRHRCQSRPAAYGAASREP